MTTTTWLAAKIKPLQDKLDAIRKGKDASAVAKECKPIQKQIDKLWAMQSEQSKYKGER